MKQILTVWLVFTALLMVLSYSTRAYFASYTAAENDYAHVLAGEMLAVLEPIYIDASDSVGDESSQERLNGAENRFAEWKYAATHFKGQLAEDFVFAFSLAEEGCRCALQAKTQADERQRRFALQLLRHAQIEFQLIAAKDYRNRQEGR